MRHTGRTKEKGPVMNAGPFFCSLFRSRLQRTISAAAIIAAAASWIA
jgi:hypothetical protein